MLIMHGMSGNKVLLLVLLQNISVNTRKLFAKNMFKINV